MPAQRVKLESRFPAVKKAMWEAVQEARDDALDIGEEETQNRIGKARSSRGYDLDPFVVNQEKTGFQSGRIFVPEERWYYKFFEYGTVYIQATPFMRPAHRKMRKAFVDKLGDKAPKFIRRKAGVRVR
jgi:HK97 gp10 family phage protein